MSCRLTSGHFHGKLASLASLPVFRDLGSTPLRPSVFCAKRSTHIAIDRYTTEKLPGERSRNRTSSPANRQSQLPRERRSRLKQFDRSRITVFGTEWHERAKDHVCGVTIPSLKLANRITAAAFIEFSWAAMEFTWVAVLQHQSTRSSEGFVPGIDTFSASSCFALVMTA